MGPSFPRLWSFGKSLIPESFFPGSKPPGDFLWNIPGIIPGSHFAPKLFPFPLSVSHGHPWKRPLPQPPRGCLCSGGQSRAVFQQNPWDLPSLSITSQLPSQQIPGNLFSSDSTLGHSSRSQETLPKNPRASPFPLFPGWGFSLAPGTFILPSTFPRLGAGIPGMSLERSGLVSSKTISVAEPIPGMPPVPLETLLFRGEFFPVFLGWPGSAHGAVPCR